jgi:rSAM/selenodomain-associated transferase 2
MQMNVGAQAAQGDILLFLHGDTRLPQGFEQFIMSTLSQPGVVAGAFELNIEGPLPGLRWVEKGVRWRSRYCQMPYGDQAIFLRATTFQSVNGFPELPIMEDFELIRRLKKQGRIAIAPAAVTTSARRWQTWGVWRTTVAHQLVILAYCLGIPPRQIAHCYRRHSAPLRRQ